MTSRAVARAVERFSHLARSSVQNSLHVANHKPMPAVRMFKATSASAHTDADQTYAHQSIHFYDKVDVVFEMKSQT